MAAEISTLLPVKGEALSRGGAIIREIKSSTGKRKYILSTLREVHI
jgi:hypothetical protein